MHNVSDLERTQWTLNAWNLMFGNNSQIKSIVLTTNIKSQLSYNIDNFYEFHPKHKNPLKHAIKGIKAFMSRIMVFGLILLCVFSQSTDKLRCLYVECLNLHKILSSRSIEMNHKFKCFSFFIPHNKWPFAWLLLFRARFNTGF